MTVKMEKKNGLAADLVSFKNGFSSFFGQLFGGGKNYDKIANYSNPKQVYDDMLRVVKIVLTLAVILSFFIGTIFHYRLFLPFVEGDKMLALIGAIVMFIVVESLSIAMGIGSFKMLFTGMFMESFLSFLAFIVMLGVVAFIFIFRYDISAKAFGGQFSDGENKKIAIKGQQLAQNTKSSYDEDIKAAKKTIKKGEGQTWHGVLTPDGETIVKEGNKTLQKLLVLKEKELNRQSVADSSYLSTAQGGVSVNKERISRYGGIIEWSIFALTFLYALFQNLSFRKNKEGIESGEISVDENGNLSQSGGQSVGFNNYGQSSAYLNRGGGNSIASKPDITAKTEKNKIGFKHYEQKGAMPSIIAESEEKKNFT